MFNSKSACLQFVPFFLLSTMAVGCGDEGDIAAPDAATVDGGSQDAGSRTDVAPTALGDGGGADSGDDTAAPGAPAFAPKGLAVVHIAYGANFSSTSSVSFTSLDGTAVLNDCIDSGSKPAGLTTALSGDVALSSSPLPSGEVALLDRSSAVITFVDPSNCAVKRQVKVGDYYANPHDFNWVAPDRAYVTRYEPNPTPTATPNDFDEGNDILIVNPLSGETKGRIDLTSFALPSAAGMTLPRPDSMLSVGDNVYVTLQNLDADLLTLKEGEGKGRVVVVNKATNQVDKAIDLPGFYNCGAIVQASPTSIVVACGGPYSTRQQQTATSGLVLIDLATQTVTNSVTAAHFGGPVSIFNLAVKADRFFTTVAGDYAAANPQPDQLWTGTFNGEPPTSVATANKVGDFGTILVHPTLPKLFLADALDSGKKGVQVRVFNIVGAPVIAEEAPLKVGAINKMPVRSIAWY